MSASLRSDLGSLLRSMSAGRWRQLVLVALLMPATALAEMAMVAAIYPFLSILAGSNGAERQFPIMPGLANLTSGTPILAAAILFGGAVLSTVLLRLALSWTSQQFAFGSGHDLAVEVQRRLLHQPYLFHLRRHSSELLTVLDKIDFLIFSTSLQGIQAISAALISLFIVAALLWIDPLGAALAAILIGGLYGLTFIATRRRLGQRAAEIQAAFEARFKAVQDSLGGIRDIILDRSQDLSVAHFQIIDGRFMRARADAQFLVAAPRFLVEGLGLILIALLAVAIAGRPGGFLAALPILGALALGAQRLLPMTSQVYAGWANLTASRPIIRELAELLDLAITDDSETAVPPLPLKRAIELDGVSFQYVERSRPALHNISLTIPKGSRVAITGKTGSGKSTLADLLMGLIEPDEGHVAVDGVALAGTRLIGWRRSVAHVPQSIFLTDDSIASNIALSLHEAVIDMNCVRRAAETAQLAEFIASLPDGFDTKIGERGARLSGGQRQRLALARAIYKNAPVLVLDEATSALDDETEAAVLRTLDTLREEGKTVIVIAHRQSTLEGCDLIVRLDHGELVEVGGVRRPASSAASAP